MVEDPNKKPVVYSFILPLVVGPINTLIVKIVGENKCTYLYKRSSVEGIVI